MTVEFVLDDHLGKLCRLLRALGHDALWCRSGSDAEIVAASAGGRVFVTRDTRWAEKTLPGRKLILSSSDPYRQLARVISECALRFEPDRFLGRCLVCNTATEEVPKASISDRLPPYVRRTRDRFRFCPGCDRVFWEGTHVEAMRRRLGELGLLEAG